MIDNDNPHTERFPFCNVVYWNGNNACGKNDDWSHADVEAFGQYPRFTVHKSKELETLISLLREAYKAGRRDKAEQIRNVFQSS